jgi:ABC-type branched-subunit amino acid transport system substrate-binding protein
MRLHRRHATPLGVAAIIVVAATAALAYWGPSGSRDSSPRDVVVVLDTPASTTPWVGAFMREGAQLAADRINAAGGMKTANGVRHVKLEILDNAGSPAKALRDAQHAVDEGAVLLLTDGTGALAVAGVTDRAQLPTVICFNGGQELIDPRQHPSLFRMAPENKAMARRLADYVANSRPKIGIISDDSEYGRQGHAELLRAFSFDQVDVAADIQVPGGSSDLSAAIVQARNAGADRLVVWASAVDTAAAVQAARSGGWSVPIYAGPAGEDPLVRQRLAAHPDWVNGLVFVSFRITSEVGPGPYAQFRRIFEAANGAEKIGLLQDGKPVVQPPDWSMFTFDTINLAAAALARSAPTAGDLLAGLQRTVITGANGDERGYEPAQHEGVNPSDIYFARFQNFTFAPVTDDPLSGSLTAVSQLAS